MVVGWAGKFLPEYDGPIEQKPHQNTLKSSSVGARPSPDAPIQQNPRGFIVKGASARWGVPGTDVSD